MGKQGVFSKILRSQKVRTNQADKPIVSSYLSTGGITECRNILINTRGHFLPRTPDNLKQLHAYVRRHYKTKNIFDRRTKAWRYLKFHDSEAERLSQRLNQTGSQTERARTLQDHPSKTNDGGRDGGL